MIGGATQDICYWFVRVLNSSKVGPKLQGQI
jgi:hypothetical protein